MPLNGASIPIGATYAPTGGSATSLVTSEGPSGGSHLLLLDDGSDLINQTTFEFSVKRPKVNSGSPSGYTQARNIILIKDPFLLDNGNLNVDTVRCEVACAYERTDAEKDQLIELLIHALVDADFASFHHDQSMA